MNRGSSQISELLRSWSQSFRRVGGSPQGLLVFLDTSSNWNACVFSAHHIALLILNGKPNP